jgi:hypothetical protein
LVKTAGHVRRRSCDDLAGGPGARITRYATQSPQSGDENQRRVEGVFEELAATNGTTSATSSSALPTAHLFTHLSMTIPMTKSTPISSTLAFAHFQQDHADRR